MTKQTFKKTKTNDKFRGIFPLEFDDQGTDANEPALPETIHLIPMGQWEHDLYGPIIINGSDIKEFIQNFNAGVRKGVFITAGHEGFEELPAVGWIKEVESRDDGLWGTVDWNNLGEQILTDKQYKFFSPEMCRDYEDPETHQFYRNVITGGALTKSPYFKELQAIVFSDKNIKNNLNKKEIMTKTLEEVLALEVTALTDEDKAVLEAGKDTLTDEQKAKFFPEVKKEETPEEKTAREAKEKEDADAKAKADEDAKAKEDAEKQSMSEKGFVKISASELSILKDAADKGMQAFKELEKKEVSDSVKTLLFSESNKAGKFLPKSADNLRAFMEKLSKEQRTSFSAIIAELPATNLFKEIGAGSATEGTAMSEVSAKVEAKMSANKNMKYSDAVKEVFAESKELEARYNSELK